MERDITWQAVIHWKSKDDTGTTVGTVYAPNERTAIQQCKLVMEDKDCQKQMRLEDIEGIEFVKAEVSPLVKQIN